MRTPIDLGKPWQYGRTESFNGKFRDECPAHAQNSRVEEKTFYPPKHQVAGRFRMAMS